MIYYISRKSFKSVSAGGDTDSLLQDMGVEFGIKLNCDGAADWSGCQNDGMGSPNICSAFVGCGMIIIYYISQSVIHIPNILILTCAPL